MNFDTFPTAISIAGFRSFDANLSTLRPLRRLNFIVGQNNSGKSNILRALAVVASTFGPDPRHKLRGVDFHEDGGAIRLLLWFPLRFLAAVANARGRNPNREVQEALAKLDRDGDFPCPIRIASSGDLSLTDVDIEPFIDSLQLDDRLLSQLSLHLASSGGSRVHNAENILNQINPRGYISNRVLLIPQVRSVHSINQYASDVDPFLSSGKSFSFTGDRLIDLLFTLQRPSFERQSDKAKFQAIVSFLRTITDNASVNIEIPHDKSAILIDMDGKVLPLHNLGAGIEELLIMATAATYFENRIICIEEPELHVHPILQRKLIAYLKNSTKNMYFIATHSPSLIDTEDASIFDVRLNDSISRVASLASENAIRAAFHELGYRASDLLQANSIIWVEGPSDRIYIKRWLELAAPDLTEGVDYSVMFYGGRLLSHLSATDESVTDLINLLKINRFSSVVMDSDRRNGGDSINSTKKRVLEEIIGAGGVAWVTRGREIENELSKEIFSAACTKIGRVSAADLDDPFADRMIRADNPTLEIDKIRLAVVAAGLSTHVPESVLEHINSIIGFIRTATFKSV